LKSIEVPEIKIYEKITLNPRDTVVMVIDMQNDFAHPKGRLFVPDSRRTIDSIARLLRRARELEIPIIYTQDWHMRDDPEFRIWGEHALAGSWGAEIIEELKPSENDIIIRKPRYDAFYGTDLEYILTRILKRDNIIITGTVANICVLHTAGSASLRWFNIVVPIDGISALNEFDLYTTLRQIDFLYKGVIVRSVDNIEFRI
jgi:nicotinamidase-related amidase